MFFLRFIRYLQGYVWFEANGAHVERFLNHVARAQIPIWGGGMRSGTFTGCVTARDYRKLRSHARKAGVHMRISGKKGVPFAKRRFDSRRGLLVGFVVFVLFVYGMSRFVWRIEVAGNETVTEFAVLQTLEELGIRPGTWSSSIDIRNCERRILLMIPNLSWAAINLQGSSLRVELSERVPPPVTMAPDAPCNIVASEAGQITALNVYEGQALVAIGDTVLPGDIVVSGIMEDSHGQNLIRHARADVIAETAQELEVAVPLAQIHYTETGKTTRRRYLELLGLDIPLFLPRKLEFPYHVERETQPLSILSFELPVQLLREEYSLMEEETVTLTEAQALDLALQELANLEKVRLDGAEVLDRGMSGALAGDAFVLRARITCRMDIGAEQEIYLQSEDTPPATAGSGAETVR